MHTLFLDIASHQGSIACVADDSTAAITPVDHRIGDSALMPAVESTLKNAGWSYRDLTHIACVVGPGGFTSLRMGVTLANTLADQLRIPAAGIHVSEVYFARHQPPATSHQQFVWLHSTKKTELFIRTFNIDDSEWQEPTLISLEKLVAGGQRLVAAQWAGELIPAHVEALASLHLQEMPMRPIEDVLPAFLKNQSYGSDLLLPWYGRGW